jgi:hypothetical protein
MRTMFVLLFVGCSSKPEPPVEAIAAAPHITIDARVAIDAPAAPELIRAITKVKLEPSFGAGLVGTSRTRPVMFVRDGEDALVTSRIDTGDRVDIWHSVGLAELAKSSWKPGHYTKSGRPELTFDLTGRLPEVLREAQTVRALMLEAGVDQVLGLATSPDGTTTIAKGGDLLFWLRDGQPPVLLDPGASYDAVVSTDGKRVAYNGCGSPCGPYVLRFVELTDAPRPRLSKLVDPSDYFWAAGDTALITRTGHCVKRVDTVSLAASDIVCEPVIEVSKPARDGVAVLLRTKTGRELRTYTLVGKLIRTVALASKIGLASKPTDHWPTTVALAPDGKALVSIAGPRATETFLVGVDGVVRPVTFPNDDYASDARWIDADRALALVRDTVYLVETTALLK